MKIYESALEKFAEKKGVSVQEAITILGLEEFGGRD